MFAGKKSFFKRVGGTAIIPLSVKILVIFISLILFSNLTTNFITLVFSQKQIIDLTNKLLVYQLTDLYSVAGNQYQISLYTQDEASSLAAIRNSAVRNFSMEHSLALGIKKDGSLLFQVSAVPGQKWEAFGSDVLEALLQTEEGSLLFKGPSGENYIGVYKYHADWDCYLVRAELRNDTRRNLYTVYLWVLIVIVILSLGFVFVGLSLLNRLFEPLKNFTKEVFALQQNKLEVANEIPIDISDAPNDDITYLAVNFNNLYVNTVNMRNIFQKFVSKHVVDEAYNNHRVELQGEEQELTILFTDIKDFTNRTEVLGNDIIRLLNIHYNSIIGIIQNDESEKNGHSKAFIGSIVGDAILGVFGIRDEGETQVNHQKSEDAVSCAWKMLAHTSRFREKMILRRKELEASGDFDAESERVFDAVMIEIGVGIDGGSVFYGNVGSLKYMTNTVIGDNVNSASRIEGLTRIYNLPVLVSEYVRNEILSIPEYNGKYIFYEIDTVQVKGKQTGTKIYFPLALTGEGKNVCDAYPQSEFEKFEKALALYYTGDWGNAKREFLTCSLKVANVFVERISFTNAPSGWSGIWTMTEK